RAIEARAAPPVARLVERRARPPRTCAGLSLEEVFALHHREEVLRVQRVRLEEQLIDAVRSDEPDQRLEPAGGEDVIAEDYVHAKRLFVPLMRDVLGDRPKELLARVRVGLGEPEADEDD